MEIEVNYHALIIVFLIDLILLLISLVYVKTFIERILCMITIFAGTFFTGLGIIFSGLNNITYLFSYTFFLIFMVITLLIMLKPKDHRINQKYNKIIESNIGLFKLFGLISLLSQLMILVYPEFKLLDLFRLPGYTFNTGVFQQRIELNSDIIRWSIDRIRLLTFPFFLVWLYTLRKHPIKFIGLYLFYNYIEFVNGQYISRSALMVIAVFIWIYLYQEKIIKRRLLIILGAVLGVVAIPASIYLSNLRVGSDNSINGFFNFVSKLISDESYTQHFLEISNSFSGDLSFFLMILSAVLSPLFFFPDIDFPVLSYAYTERILGISYGQANYYILLPGAFGEGVMLFGKWGAWLYGIFIGWFVGFVYRKLKSIPYFNYWIVYFIMDLARAYRGGIQTFIIATMNSSLLMILVLVLMKVWSDKYSVPENTKTYRAKSLR